MTLVLTLLAIGLLLLVFEVLLPGGIAGLFGFIFIIAASAICYRQYGTAFGMGTFLLSSLLAALILIGGIKILPHTRIGKKLFHREANQSISIASASETPLIGKQGKAAASLAPTGLVMIDEQNYEARSESGFIEKGTPVKVVEQTNLELIMPG